MTMKIVVAGTGTDIGKTIFAAGLTAALDACYWKPIQAGLDSETDTACVQRLAGLSAAQVVDEAYRLRTPASPHIAAEIDGIEIDVGRLTPPASARPMVIELAGGLAVPLTRRVLQIDVIASWRLPVILCASTQLGTINHSLLSVEALKTRAVPILGVAFIGDDNSDSRKTICAFGGVKDLGRLPTLSPLTPEALRRAFAQSFSLPDLLGLGLGGP